MGAAGRDFHVFNTVFRDDPGSRVVAFTAAQIPGIDDRTYPPELAGPAYPDGIPIRPEAEIEQLIEAHAVDEVVFAYSDLPHVEVMHVASRVLAAGADFTLVGPKATMLESTRPVVAVVASRTGCGKSQTSRVVAGVLRAAGLRVAWVRHPMPYGDLAAMAVQRFASRADLAAAALTVEELEEYERPVDDGFVVWAGVDYEAILHRAEAECDVVLWDGGNNDFAFFRPDLTITVVDALRPGHETTYHPGEVNLRTADVVVINKVDAAAPGALVAIREAIAQRCRPGVAVVEAASEVSLADGPPIAGARVLVVEDGPSLTHGGLAGGAGLAAARAGHAEVIDPRPYAVGSLAAVFERFGQLGPVLPAMGYSPEQVADLRATVRAARPEVVLAGTPIDLASVLDGDVPVRRVRYELRELGSPTLAEVLAPCVAAWSGSSGEGEGDGG